MHDDADGPTLEEICARLAPIARQAAHAALRPVRASPAPPRRPPRAPGASFRLKGAPPVLTNDVKSFGFRFRFSNAKLRALGWTPRIGIAEGMDEAFAYFASRQGGDGQHT